MNKFLKISIALLSLIITEQGKASGDDIIVFKKNYLEKGNYKDVPSSNATLDKIIISAAPGEYEPFQVLLRSKKDIPDVTAFIEDLRSGKDIINKNNVEMRIAVDQKRWHDTSHFERIPYLLFKESSFNIKAEETARIWLDVHVPENAAPGKYFSKLTLTANGNKISDIPIELTVWPFNLLEINPDEMSYSVCSDTVFWPKWAKGNMECLTAAMKDFKEHGMNSIFMTLYSLPISSHENPMTYKDTRASFSVEDDMNAMEKSGMINKKGKFFSAIIPQNEASPFINEAVEKFKTKGWELVGYGIDEPASPEKQKAQKDLYNKYKKICPEMKIITALNSFESINAIGDYLDIWAPMSNMLTEKVIKDASLKGKMLFSYECQTAPTDPLTYRHYLGFLAWKTQIKGAYLWVYYCAGQTDNQMRAMPRDTAYFDPERQNKYDLVFLHKGQIIPSVGWKGVREGIDDYRYIATLEKWIAIAEEKGLTGKTADAKKLLQELNGKIQPDNFTKTVNEMQKKGLATWYFDRPIPEASLKTEDYDAYRHKIAEEIIKLSSIVKENQKKAAK